jgi:hypothetical protein
MNSELSSEKPEAKIIDVIRATEPLKGFEFSSFEWIYDSEERTLHVQFDAEQEADSSIYAEPNPDVQGEILIHAAGETIVGFSILETDLGKEESK